MELFSLLNSADSLCSTLTFFNPAVSAFGVSVSIQTGSVQISMAEPFDKSNRGFAKAGELRYDWPNKYVFSLTPAECYDICKNFDALVKGEFRRAKDNYGKDVDEKYQGMMSFQHQTRKIFLGPIESRMDGGINSLRVGIYDPEKGKSVTYIFRESELALFKNFINSSVSLLPFMTAVVNSSIKMFKSALFAVNNPDGSGQHHAPAQKTTAPVNASSGISSSDFDIFDESPIGTASAAPAPAPAPTPTQETNEFDLGNVFSEEKSETPKQEEKPKTSTDFDFPF